MRDDKTIFALFVLVLAGCGRYPAPAPPPAQRSAEPAGHYAFLAEPGAERFIVSGVDGETHGGQWRWTGRKAVLRFTPAETQGVEFQAVITIPDELARAGSKKITVSVDGRELGVIPAGPAGYVVWKKPVPAQWLAAARPVVAALAVDKTWRQGNEERGVMLVSAGFTL